MSSRIILMIISEAEQGYVFAQFYPNSNYLDLCICDAGKRIYQSFLDNPKFNPANDIEAMQLALSGNSTKDSPEQEVLVFRLYGICS